MRCRGRQTTFPLGNRERVDPEQLCELYLRQPELRSNSVNFRRGHPFEACEIRTNAPMLSANIP